MSMPFLAFSKSSIYEALPCAPLLLPAMSWAKSAVKLMDEGVVHSTNGNLSSIFVNHWLCFFQERFTPHIVLLRGSLPIATLVVKGFSPRCMSVPPTWKFLEKSYCQLNPNMVLRCMPYSVLLSRLTLTGVPASRMLLLRILTIPEL